MGDQPDIMSAIRQIAAERKIDFDEIVNAIKQAIKAGFKREYAMEHLDLLEVEFDPQKGHIAVLANKKVVKKVTDDSAEISVKDAQAINKKLKEGDSVLIDITPSGDFGRIAAQTSRQIILQKLREAEKDAAIKEITAKMGSIETITIHRFTQDGEVLAELNKARAVMPKSEQIGAEYYRVGSRIKVLLKAIEEDTRGKYILISRSDPDFLRELFRMEVPEIDSGTVEIVSIAREEGSRSKVAVKSNSSGVDPLGACIGQKGVRINAISNELRIGAIEEKLDIILWDEDIKTYLMNAIRPAEAIDVDIVNEKEKHAVIIVPDEQLSLAIGKDGQNVRLSHKLTGWKLDIASESEYKAKKVESKSETKSKAKSEGKKEEKVKKVKAEKPAKKAVSKKTATKKVVTKKAPAKKATKAKAVAPKKKAAAKKAKK